MQKWKVWMGRATFLAGLLMVHQAYAGWGDVLKSATQGLGSGGMGAVSEEKAAAGLKEALRIGTENAVEQTSQPDGFYGNPTIRIGLPESVERFEGVIRMAGYGEQLDALVLSMNRAAEKATPMAQDIFLDAVGEMSFEDARKILQGRENEATLYFRDKTYDPLYRAFKPVVEESMSQTGVPQSLQALNSQVSTLPFVGNLSPDLNDYVTRGSLDGLFHVLAEEEKKIRENPAARTTDLLKEVFSR